MNQIELKKLLEYNPKTGFFTNLVTRSDNGKALVGTVAGNKNKQGYWVIRVLGKRYTAHRLAYFYMTGEWPKDQIDHKNNNRADNRWENLRPATKQENARNVKNFVHNRSGLKGVGFDSKNKKWRARICVNGKSIFLGMFLSKEEAGSAYIKAAQKYHKDFARY